MVTSRETENALVTSPKGRESKSLINPLGVDGPRSYLNDVFIQVVESESCGDYGH